MSTTIFAVMNEKGGVGKSTTAIELAHFYAGTDADVILIDLDPLCAASHACGVSGHEGATIADVLAGRTTVDKCAKTRRIGKGWRSVRIVPGSLDLEDAVTDLVAADDGVFALRRALAGMSAPSAERVVVVDCPAGLNVLTLNALIAADVVLVPTTPHAWSIAGAYAIMGKVGEVNDVRAAYELPPITGACTLVTMFDMRTSADREGLATVQNDARLNYVGMVPRRTGRDAGAKIREHAGDAFRFMHDWLAL